MPLGAFTLTATLDRLRASTDGTLLVSGATLTVDLHLTGEGEVSGRLLLSNGQIAAGATVVLRHALAGTRELVTDANGAFIFSAVPTGSYVLDIVHGATGELARIPGGLAEPGDSRRYQLALAGLGTLRVNAMAAGVPAAGVRVALALRGTLAAGREATTDANGVAEFTAVPRVDYGITATRSGADTREYFHYIGTLAGASDTVALALERNYLPQATITGRVLDARARPVPDQWVRVSTRDTTIGSPDTFPQPIWSEYLIRSDSAGNYRFDNVVLDTDGRFNFKVDVLIDGILRGRAIPSAVPDALLNIALADSFIAAWYTKYYYWTARPVTMAKVVLGADHVPAILTPPFPSYVSGHAAFSGAAARILGVQFPDEQATVDAMAEEAAMSRLYGGIHYRFDNEDGLAMGRAVADLVLQRFGGRNAEISAK